MILLLDAHALLWWLRDEAVLDRAAGLPMHHRDPFDRMILAQALRLDAVIVSRDPALEAYDVAILRA